jgi:hypothetical protein
MEDVGERLSRRRGLLASGRFRFLLFVGFALFLLGCAIVSPLSRDRGVGQPTINRLATGLYGGSNVVVLILPVLAFAAERPMKQATGCGGLGRIDVRNGSAGRRVCLEQRSVPC